MALKGISSKFNSPKRLYWLVVLCIFSIISFISIGQLFAQTNNLNGFHKILDTTGVQVYQKSHAERLADFVTVVDLRKASIRNLIGASNSNSIYQKSLNEFWNVALADNAGNFRARAVINGTFFSPNDNPTGIAFGLKKQSQFMSYGYGLKEYPNLTKTFSFDSITANASIQDYSQSTFNSSQPDVIGALDITANKSATSYLGRTFVGTVDTDRDTIAETVLFFSSQYARQSDANNVLRAFGVTNTAMLDGGGSTGLIVDGSTKILTARTIPHAIAIYAGKP